MVKQSGLAKYEVREADLERCFAFSVEYHLDERKNASNRTTGQYRGLGGIIDSFFIGKLIEVGVVGILEKFTRKKMVLDFKIHELNKESRTDPDIIRVREGGKKRTPRLYVEIKNVSPDDRWIGLTAEQFASILKNNIVDDNPAKVFVVCASLISKNKTRSSDLLGVYLKSRVNHKLLKEFCDFDELFVEIQYILSGTELRNKGTCFKEGSYMYETDIFEEVEEKLASKIRDPQYAHVYKKLRKKGKTLPIVMRDGMPKPKEFGEFNYSGVLEIYTKKNPKSKRMYVFCKSNVVIRNEVLGIFKLKKGRVYECFFTTVGQNPTLKRNNVWIAQRNLCNVVSCKVSDRIRKIAKHI